MAAHHSLSIDEEACSHYYHCALSDVPFQCTIQQIAELIVPGAADPSAVQLAALGCRIVPHKLYTYKETLPRKLGYLTYYIHHRGSGTRDDAAIHHHFLTWLEVELPLRLQTAGGANQTTRVLLAQPKNCYVAGPFLKELNRAAEFLSPSVCKDPRKMETFLLGKVVWQTATAAAASERATLVEGAEADDTAPPSTAEQRIQYLHQKKIPEEPWGVVGTVVAGTLSPEELVWLRKEHHGCQTSTAAVFEKEGATEAEKAAAVRAFLTQTLRPLLAVE
jgi:hypothetical protein